jgi:ubiquitin-activating enzyme E1
MLETPDLRYFGRSDQIHLAINAIFLFQKNNGRLPHNNAEDLATCQALVKEINESNKASEGINVDAIDEDVVKNTVSYAVSCISPMAAFFGGVIA